MSSNQLPSLARSNISDEVYQILKDRIIRNQFSPGERLNLDEIQTQLGISRTPLMNALTLLSAEGLTEIKPRQGTFVTNPTLVEIAENFDVRRVLEMYALSLAVPRLTEAELQHIKKTVKELESMLEAENWEEIYPDYVSLDEQLHRFIMRVSGNKRLGEIWEQVNVHVQMARFRRLKLATVLGLGQSEHEEMVKVFEERDVDRLQQIMGDHIEHAKQLLLEDLSLQET